MYHYTESGLKNIWLVNGYVIHRTDYGEGVSIENVTGLHKAIADTLINKPNLTGPEFRFLRKEIGLSQKSFGQSFGYEGQTIALWEKRSRVPKAAALFVKTLYCEKVINKNAVLSELINAINDLDHKVVEKVLFEETGAGWSKAA